MSADAAMAVSPRRVSARGLTTAPAVARELARRPSGYVLAGVVAAALCGRRRLGRVGAQDAVAVALAVAVQPFVEWGVHRHVLHGRSHAIGGRTLDPGAPHRGHHDDPDDVAGLLLGGGFAAVDAALVAGLVAAAGALVSPIVGRYPARAVLTGVAAGAAGLARYEWCHLLFHSACRPRSARVRRLRAHHLAHHHRDAQRWLGVTSDLADRLFRTTGPGVVGAASGGPRTAERAAIRPG